MNSGWSFEEQYASLADHILHNGSERHGRNGMTKAIFFAVLHFDLENGLPLIQGRKIYYKGIFGELAAMLKGPKCIKDFEDQGCNYWDKWGNACGNINVDYGNAWLNFNGYNQLEALVKGLKEDPHGRRHIVTGWNPSNLADLSLPCCHLLYQWYVQDGKLDMAWHQRSADWMIGVPSDAVLAAAWNIALAKEVGLEPGKVFMTFGDSHIYEEHFLPTHTYLQRVKSMDLNLPVYYKLNDRIKEGTDHTKFVADWIEVLTYNPAPPIKFELKE